MLGWLMSIINVSETLFNIITPILVCNKHGKASLSLDLYFTWLCTEVFLIPNPLEASGGLNLKLCNDYAKAWQCWVNEHNLCFENTVQHTHSCTCTWNKSGWSNINSTKMFPGSLKNGLQMALLWAPDLDLSLLQINKHWQTSKLHLTFPQWTPQWIIWGPHSVIKWIIIHCSHKKLLVLG